ncbi:DUF4198 domain-containing protein [Haloferula chungangensis]|uniref:DUF4198 domain-containing protein n=1 Tax=Haloferula chungangensis TaxID=1048331 RepID=A0ABW2LA62_9BACT
MKLRSILLASSIVGLALQPAFAHRFWIIPSTSVLSGDKPWVCFDAAISNDLFFPNHVAPEVEDFTITGPDGSSVEKQNGCVGELRTTFDAQLEKPGTYQIATLRSMLFASWEEGGEEKRWRGSLDKIAEVADKPDVQFMHSHSRVECFVTSGEPTTPKPSGKGLELIYDKTHPNDLYAGEAATFILHKDGKPVGDVDVYVIKGDDRYRDDSGETKTTTAKDGSFTVEWPEAGRFWLYASIEGEGAKVEGKPAKDRSAYTATFEVLPQ